MCACGPHWSQMTRKSSSTTFCSYSSTSNTFMCVENILWPQTDTRTNVQLNLLCHFQQQQQHNAVVFLEKGRHYSSHVWLALQAAKTKDSVITKTEEQVSHLCTREQSSVLPSLADGWAVLCQLQGTEDIIFKSQSQIQGHLLAPRGALYLTTAQIRSDPNSSPDSGAAEQAARERPALPVPQQY